MQKCGSIKSSSKRGADKPHRPDREDPRRRWVIRGDIQGDDIKIWLRFRPEKGNVAPTCDPARCDPAALEFGVDSCLYADKAPLSVVVQSRFRPR